MNQKREKMPGLLTLREEVDDLRNFKAEWADVIDAVFDTYGVSTNEEIFVIDALFKNFNDHKDEEVTETDVIDALQLVRAVSQDIH